jgi:hypothetical protein
MRFRTSVKNIRGRIEWRPLSPQLIVCAVSLAAFAVGIVHLALDFRIGPLAYDFFNMASGNFQNVNWNQRLDQGYTLELVAISGFWALFNAAKCLYLVHKATRDARQPTEDYRFQVRVPLEIETESGQALACVDRLSQTWASARWCEGNLPATGKRLRGWLHLPAGVIPVDFVVVRSVRPAVWKLKIGPLAIEIWNSSEAAKAGRLDCELLWSSPQGRRRLAESLYSVDWHREFMHRHAFFTTPLQAVARLLRLRRPFGRNISWSPAIYRVPDTGDLAYAIVDTQDRNRYTRLIAFRTIHSGQTIDLRVLGNGGVLAHSLKVLGRESLRSLAHRGLDGATMYKYRVVADERALGLAQPFVVAAE